ncbi:hypothetical protein MXB_677 [Myxobolus squamalis]|nr:hypothetical protein MXB_677 [Myxobolus squamalis]
MLLKIYKNKDRIVKVGVHQDSLKSINEGESINYTYQVEWIDSSISFTDRYSIYYFNSSSSLKIRTISLVNSIAMMLIVAGFALWILFRTLRYDLMRYNQFKMFKNDNDFEDLYGWKLVHKDVYRHPVYFELLSSFVGIGIQIFLTIMLATLLVIFMNIFSEPSRVIYFGLYMYITVCPISAFVSSSIYKKYVSQNFHSAVSDTPGLIPRRKWYLKFWPLVFISGLLPFGAIVVEIYFVLVSFWATKITLLFPFLLVVLLVMVALVFLFKRVVRWSLCHDLYNFISNKTHSSVWLFSTQLLLPLFICNLPSNRNDLWFL